MTRTRISFHLRSTMFRLGVLGLAGALLAGCAASKREAPSSCPEVKLLEEASNITKFVDGPGRDLIDVLFEGTVVDAVGACEYDMDDDTGEGNLAADMRVTIELSRGPANQDRQAEFGYFVAVTDTDRNILNKQAFSGAVTFPGNRTRLNWSDEQVYLNIPLKAGQTGEDFLFFIGFDLSRDEVRFNRAQLSRTRP